MRVADGEARISRPSLFSSDMLAMLMHSVRVLRWANTQKKLERVAEIVAVVAIQGVG